MCFFICKKGRVGGVSGVVCLMRISVPDWEFRWGS